MVRRLAYIILLLLMCKVIEAQQLPLYSQYIYNRFLINPAVAGSDGYTSLNLTAREQWVGYYGAPRTFSFSFQARMLKRGYILRNTGIRGRVFRPSTDGKVGFGGYIFSDKNGLVQRTGFQAAYSYHMWLQNSTQLSLGLAFTGYHFRINEKDMVFEDPDEPWMNNELRKGMFVPDATFGVYLLNAKYSVGFSAEQLFGAAARLSDATYRNYYMSRHFYIFGTYYFSTSAYSEIQPSFLFKMSDQLRPQLDIGANYNFDQTFWAGLAYRTSGAIITNVGFRYERMYIGYAIDFTLQEIQRVTYGTHEITIAFKFGDSARKYRWIDRY